MPCMRAMGGGVLLIEAANYTRVMLTPDKWCGLDLLLKEQPYVADVRPWQREAVHFNGNDFRARLSQALSLRHTVPMHREKHLCHWMCDAHGLPYSVMDTAWLTVQHNKVARVVINRSGPGRDPHHVYHHPTFPWHYVWQKYHKDAVFVGTTDEYKHFSATCGLVPHYPTANLYEAAKVIAGADLFIGNQSSPHAIAEGMKKRIFLEVWPSGPNCLVFREGVTHWWKHEVELPEL